MNLNFLSRSIITISACVLAISCSKNPSPDPIDSPVAGGPANIDYDFTQPQYVSLQDFYAVRGNGFKQLSSIKENNFLNAVGNADTYSDLGNNQSRMTVTWNFTRNGITN